MIIHIWMHWFWITTVYFRGSLLFVGQTISLTCVSYPHVAEAGLRENETVTPITPEPYAGTNSSQPETEPNAASPAEGGTPPETTPSSSSSPREETGAEDATGRPEDGPRTALGAAPDLEDVYAGGALDVFQYPLKKFTKYSHLKYGKAKAKGKPSDEPGVESVKLVEEKVNINISITDGRSGAEVDKSNERPGEGGTSEVPASDTPDLITTTLAAEVATSESGSEAPERNATVQSATRASEVPAPPTEDHKEVEVLKNETLVIENKVEETGAFTTVEPFVAKNRVAAATSAQNYELGQSELNAGSITGITLGILVVFSLFGAVSFVLYRRRYLNKPQVLHDKCSNLDSSGYIDETSLRENSEEMYSLDNDSFLNSLEAMTIQNYWTENVKHTKL